MKQRIFVQIPAYRDSELASTITSLFENAEDKEALDVWICWQHDASEVLPKSITENPQVNIIDIDWRKSRGCGWARRILQQQWDGQEYSFLIDSHLRFVKGWDKYLVQTMVQLKRQGHKKPIISTLPPAYYSPQNFPQDRANFPTNIYPRNHEMGMLIRFYAEYLPLFRWLKEPVPARFLGMCFVFADGRFNEEVPIDPDIYFFGDDITTALRAHCHGYDFFHPQKLVAWHLYDRGTRVTHWDDHQDWTELNQVSYERVRASLLGQELSGFPRGKKRSFNSFKQLVGWDLVI